MSDETPPAKLTPEEQRREMRERFDALNVESQNRHDGRRNLAAVKMVEDKPASPTTTEQVSLDTSAPATPASNPLQSSEGNTPGG